jgi:hypothetical protein
MLGQTISRLTFNSFQLRNSGRWRPLLNLALWNWSVRNVADQMLTNDPCWSDSNFLETELNLGEGGRRTIQTKKGRKVFTDEPSEKESHCLGFLGPSRSGLQSGQVTTILGLASSSCRYTLFPVFPDHSALQNLTSSTKS